MLHIGTSGYSYSYWKSRFYPEGLAASKWLGYYATVFNSVEINNTFYRFPTVKSLSHIASKTPDDFIVSVKAHKIITHTMRLRDAAEKVKEFVLVCEQALGPKLGCVLYQLPPSYSYTEERLSDVIASIPHNDRHVVEFRHASWWNDSVYSKLRSCNITFCSVSYPNLPTDLIATSELIYLRMHGVPELFKSSYGNRELKTIASRLRQAKGFVYFNNTTFEAGYENALYLKSQLAGLV